MKSILSKINPKNFSSKICGKETFLFVLRNSAGMEVSITNFGGRIVELFAPDRFGNFADVVLGHNTIGEYADFKGGRFFGAAVGRYANRISGAEFSIGGKLFKLEQNNGANSLHGGSRGFDMLVWDVADFSDSELSLRLLSPDGDGGFPGNLFVDMTYKLREDNSIEIKYAATTDAPTHVNLTNHSFFNLRGEGDGDIRGHILTINADYFTPVNDKLIPTGELRFVEGTPFDFRSPKTVGERLCSADAQLQMGGGYDHNWVLNKSRPGGFEEAASLYEPTSGRIMRLYTTEPGLQFFSGNSFSGAECGKNGKAYIKHAALALETQHFPDTPNRPEFPSTLLLPGQTYSQRSAFKFDIVRQNV